jgi:60 kDa SS-A/Ro ribonucleoprotein
MRTNVNLRFTEKTHEGAPASRMTPLQALRRSVMSCLLWEKEFYEDGQTIAERIEKLASQVTVRQLADVAIEARNVAQLRHVPLLLLRALVAREDRSLLRSTIPQVIQRADEIAEFVSLYFEKGRRPLANQMKRGLGDAFGKFDEYQLAKYEGMGAVKLRDVLRLTHPKPSGPEQSELWRRLDRGELARPDTWESALAGGADKRETFTRLLQEGKLGYLALLRNLRGMTDAGVDRDLIVKALGEDRGAARVLPFRYVAAARAAPSLEPAIDKALLRRIATAPTMPGRTVVLIDVSGSMDRKLSERSDLTRMDAAAALGAIVPGDVQLFTFSNSLVAVPARKGMAGVDAIIRSQLHSGTNLAHALDGLNKLAKKGAFARLIVVTDEQTATRAPAPKFGRNYLINVASAKNGVSYGKEWTHIDGFSENVLRFIMQHEEG